MDFAFINSVMTSEKKMTERNYFSLKTVMLKISRVEG